MGISANSLEDYTYLIEESGYYCIGFAENYPIYIYQSSNIIIKDINNFKEDINSKILNLVISDSDFEISDENSNTIFRLQNGHIITKNFDSSSIIPLDSNLLYTINRYKNKKISILGDSISTFGDPSSTNENGTYCWSYYPTATCRYSVNGIDSIQFDVNDTYWMKLIKATSMILGVNESWRGSTVSGSGSSAFNHPTRINHLGENGTPDIILIYGGTNDAGRGVTIGTFNTENPINYTDKEIENLPVSTFADAYRTMLIRIMKKYPLAEIIVLLPTSSTYYTITNLDLYVEIIKEACDFFLELNI